MANSSAVQMQQQQTPNYNHPSQDLIDDGGRREEYLKFVVPLYQAAMKGDWVAAEPILHGKKDLLSYSINERKETLLHIAAARDNPEFVAGLVNMMDTTALALQNKDGNTAFCIAAISGYLSMVEPMFAKDSTLAKIRGCENMMPLHIAALHGNQNVVNFLHGKPDAMSGWTNKDMDEVFYNCIRAENFDVALKILKDKEEVPQDEYAYHVLQLLARKPDAFKETTTKADKIKSYLAFTRLVTKPAIKESSATLLLRFLWRRIMKRPMDVIDKILRGPMIKENGVETYPSQVLFISAEMDNVKFLVELISESPDLIWKTNDEGQTIFHISISHRHEYTSSLLLDIGSMKDLITPITDKQDNNILHLVAMEPKRNVLKEDRVFTPFRFFDELLWYKGVEILLPRPYRDAKNKEGQTPKEVFIRNHEKQASEYVKWIHDTINQSLVVSALVCTIGFSVVTQLPGGSNDSGFPIFLKREDFQGYVALNLMSFIFSTSSMIAFLTIVLSRSIQNAEMLLIRWTLGQICLLVSIYCLVYGFFTSFFTLYRHVNKGQLLIASSGLIVLIVGFYIYMLAELWMNLKLMSRVKLHRRRAMLY